MTRSTLPFAALLVIACWAAAGVQAEDSDARENELRIETLIARLADSDFSVREKASEELIAIGEPALARLKQAAEDPDAETAWRAKKAVEEIEAKLATKKNEPQESPDEGPSPFEGMEGIPPEMRRMFEGFGGLENFSRQFSSDGSSTKTTVKVGDDEYTFEKKADGAIAGKVVRTEGGDAVTKEFSYESEDAFEKADPELFEAYKKYGNQEGQGFELNRGPFQFRFRMGTPEGMEGFGKELQDQLERMREELERSFGGRSFGREGSGFDRERERAQEQMEEEEREFDRMREEMERPDEGAEPAAPKASQDPSHGGLSGSPAEEVLRAQLGISEDQGLLVSGVADSSEAARFGFERWDLVLAANGKPVNSIDLYRAAIESVEPGEEIVFEIVRRGKREEIRATK